MSAEKQLNGLTGALGELVANFGDIKKITEMTQDLLPKDKFTAEIDGHTMEVSMGLSGKAIVFNFTDDIKCSSLFNELKQNKQGFFKRIFNIK